MLYLEKLKSLKAKKGLTNAEIAQLSNIPLATITRIFNGQMPNPTFETFSQIAIALGASLDEITGINQSNSQIPIEKTLNSYSALLKEKDERIKEFKEQMAVVRREKAKLWITFTCVVGFVLIVLIVDLFNGHFGYFRY